MMRIINYKCPDCGGEVITMTEVFTTTIITEIAGIDTESKIIGKNQRPPSQFEEYDDKYRFHCKACKKLIFYGTEEEFYKAFKDAIGGKVAYIIPGSCLSRDGVFMAYDPHTDKYEYIDSCPEYRDYLDGKQVILHQGGIAEYLDDDIEDTDD